MLPSNAVTSNMEVCIDHAGGGAMNCDTDGTAGAVIALIYQQGASDWFLSRVMPSGASIRKRIVYLTTPDSLYVAATTFEPQRMWNPTAADTSRIWPFRAWS
jgi:hypothetical protein